jgi:hypothetical protein
VIAPAHDPDTKCASRYFNLGTPTVWGEWRKLEEEIEDRDGGKEGKKKGSNQKKSD